MLTSLCPVTASPRSSVSPPWARVRATVQPQAISVPSCRPGGLPMRDLLGQLRDWWTADTAFALATVVGVRGSAPRQPGASMAVSSDGEAVGRVSGGCVEGAVYELATEVLQTGEPVLQTYGISDEDAFAVGLTCGGILDILVRPVDARRMPAFAAVARPLGREEPVALATVVSGDAPISAQVAVWADRDEGTL